MTVAASTAKYVYTGDGTSTAFPFPSLFFQNGDILVGVNGVLQVAGYSVSGAGNPSGGTVTFTTAPVNGAKVILLRKPAFQQLVDFVNGQTVLEGTIETALDRLTMMAQYLLDASVRSLRVGDLDADTAAEDLLLPNAATRASKLLGFDADGVPVATSPTAVGVGSIGTTELADASVTAAKLAVGAALANLANNSITNAKLAAGVAAANLGFVPAPNRVYDVTLAPFSATLGGSLDTALPAAVAAAEAAGGGTVLIPASLTWTLSVPVPMGNNVTVRGMGRGATTITCTSATAHMFAATSKNMMGFFDMTLDNSATKTAGSAFYLNTCSVVAIRNVQIANHIFPIEEVGSVSIWFDEIEISGLKASTGIGIIIDGGNDHYLRNVFIKTASIAGQALAGINIRATGGTWLSGCGTLWCNDGLLINPGTGKVVEHIFSTMNAYDTGTGHGIRIVPSGTGIVRRNYFVQDWTATNSENGVTVDATAGTVDTNFFIGHRSVNNLKHGVRLMSGVNTHFRECYTSGNSGASSGTYDGIRVENGVTDFSVIGCQCGASAGFSNIQGYGINVDGSTHDRYKILHNDCSNNVTGGHRDAGATTGKQVYGNLPLSTGDRLRTGGLNFLQTLATGWQIDSDISGFTLASGAEVTLTTGSGMLLLTLASSGGTAMVLLGGGAISITQVGTSFANTSTPSASQIGVYFDGGTSTYRVKNGFATTQTIYPGSWKTRPAN